MEARQKLPNEKPKRTPGIFLEAESPFKLLLKKKIGEHMSTITIQLKDNWYRRSQFGNWSGLVIYCTSVV